MSSDLATAEVPTEAMGVLHFWFLELMPENWFSSSDQVDGLIVERFGDLFELACAGACDHWAETPRGMLALIIVLDQFSRNIHRGNGEAFAQDKKAQTLVQKAIDDGFDERLSMNEKQFLYMPLMHAENSDLQKIGVEKFEALAQSAIAVSRFAQQHHDIIERFGRFPYRNPMLGRPSTLEERAFIDAEGNPFG